MLLTYILFTQSTSVYALYTLGVLFFAIPLCILHPILEQLMSVSTRIVANGLSGDTFKNIGSLVVGIIA